jgi:omega-6 fatty acid desaturase (delta-12 desaturase)
MDFVVFVEPLQGVGADMGHHIDRMALAPYSQRSVGRSLAYLTADLVVYAAFVYGALAADALWLKLVFALGAGVMISLTAIAGHDAGHQSFSGSKVLNRICGTIAFLPALHPFALWEHHHNRVHHRFTAQIGVDNAFSPMTVEAYRNASPRQRAYYRFMRSLWGQPFFYLLDVWVPEMMLLPFTRKTPMTSRVWFDFVLVCAYFALFVTACTLLSLEAAGGSVWAAAVNALVFGFAVPFLVWNVFISFLSIVQHTGPDVRWVMPTGVPSTVEQSMAGTVHVVLPEWVDRLLHRIMQHQAHHVHVGIPLQELKAAQSAVEEMNGGQLVRVWTPAYHLQLTRECQLFDPHFNRWRRFADLSAELAVQDIAA